MTQQEAPAQPGRGYMERQLLERMIGAGVLLVALVVVVPAILDGRRAGEVEPEAPVAAPEPPDNGAPMRQITIRPDQQADAPPIARDAVETPAEPEPEPVAAEPEPEPEPVAAEPEPAVEPEPPAAPPRTEPPAAAKAEPEPAPEPVKPVVPPTPSIAAGWVVQLGSFSSRENAQGLANRTRERGFDAYLMPIERSGKTLYRVRVGPPRKTRGEAARLADDLKKAGFAGQVAEQTADG